MQHKHILNRFIYYMVIAFWVLAFSVHSSGNSLDLSTPERAFGSLQNALCAADVSAIQHILADIPGEKDNNYSMALGIINELKKKEKDSYLLLLCRGTVLRVEKMDGLSWGCPRSTVWIRWVESKIMGAVGFVEQEGNWRWFPMLYHAAYEDYDLSTPTAAFLSLRRARHSGNSAMYTPIGDTFGIYNCIASDLKGAMSFEDYDKLVKGRRVGNGWISPSLSYDTDHLEEEMLEPERKTGRSQCKIWKLDKKGKRVGFDLFVKEGEDWKWLPDPKYIWFPAKVAKKENKESS